MILLALTGNFVNDDYLGDVRCASVIRLPSMVDNAVPYVTNTLLHLLKMKGLFGRKSHED